MELGPSLPDEMLFAARWWLPFLVLALAAPAYFRRLTGSRSVGYLIGSLMVLSPASAWWSFGPLTPLAWSMAGAVMMLRAKDAFTRERWVAGVVDVLIAGGMLARTIYGYQPWGVVLVPAIVLTAAASAVLFAPAWKRGLGAVLGAGVAAVAMVGLLAWEHRAEIATVTSTVYPGARRATGGANTVQDLFAATSLEVLTDNLPIGNSNYSEISSSYAVVLVWLLLLIAHGLRFNSRNQRAVLYTALGITAAWTAWSTINFGSIGFRLPLVNTVPPNRSADVLGYLALLVLGLTLPLVKRSTWTFAAMAGLVVAGVSAYAGYLTADGEHARARHARHLGVQRACRSVRGAYHPGAPGAAVLCRWGRRGLRHCVEREPYPDRAGGPAGHRGV